MDSAPTSSSAWRSYLARVLFTSPCPAALLGILGGRRLIQEPLGELVPVDLGEKILVAKEGEELHLSS